MKINFLTQYFDPEPVIRDKKFIRDLANKGNLISVVTGYPNYPTGKIYSGFKQKIYSKIIIDNFELIRLPLFAYKGKNLILRILNIFTFFISLSTYLLFFSKKKDISYAANPPPTVAIAALILKIFRGTPYIIDILDLWPQSLESTGFVKNKSLLKLINLTMNLIYRNALHIIVTSPGMKNTIIKSGINSEKISLIYNWAPEDRLLIYKKKPIKFQKKGLNLLYAGNIGPAQKIDILIDIAKHFSDKNIDINFNIIGTGISKKDIINKANKLNCNNVFFYPYVDQNEIANYFEAADVGIVKLNESNLFKITIPGKTSAYMAFGLPILMLVSGDAAEIVNDSNCGVSCEPENKEQIIKAIEYLYSKKKDELEVLGNNGKVFYNTNISSEIASNKLNILLHNLNL